MVKVIEIPDDSVNKKIEKVARRLSSKYGKKRKINEKRLLKIQTPFQKFLSVVSSILCVIFVVVSGIVCFSSFNSRLQNVAPTFLGYSTMKIVSGSMVASGFNIGDSIVVRQVDTTTLKEGDHIAFYVYSNSYLAFDINTCQKVVTDDNVKHIHNISILNVLGVQSEPIRQAAKNGARLVFHTITNVYTDGSGLRWFTTKGSSNISEDNWYISENMVVGVYDNSTLGVCLSHIINATTHSTVMLLLIIIPLVFMGIIIVAECLKDVEIAKLELDVVEERRALTDRVCLKNNVGYHMSKETKYKVLAQAPLDKKAEYISLLWKDGTAPNSVKKYYLKKSLIMRPMEKKLELHRECEKMYHDHVPVRKIAEHYIKQNDKIEKQELRYKNIFKKLSKKNKSA